jgi:hypothetical protein
MFVASRTDADHLDMDRISICRPYKKAAPVDPPRAERHGSFSTLEPRMPPQLSAGIIASAQAQRWSGVRGGATSLFRIERTYEASGSISHIRHQNPEVLLQAAWFRHRCTRCRPVRPPRSGAPAPRFSQPRASPSSRKWGARACRRDSSLSCSLFP